MDSSITSPALTLLMKHLSYWSAPKAPNFSAFHLSPHGSLVSAPFRNHEYINRKGPKRASLQNRTEADLITESDKAVRAVHSCNN